MIRFWCAGASVSARHAARACVSRVAVDRMTAVATSGRARTSSRKTAAVTFITVTGATARASEART